MPKFTVTITQEVVCYSSATIEVEAANEDDAATQTKLLDEAGKLPWDSKTYDGAPTYSFEVSGDTGGTICWRED